MTLFDAAMLLSSCFRDKCVDHSFGDEEVSWFDADNRHVAEGYFSSVRGYGRVSVGGTTFEGDDAKELRGLGKLRSATRNDEQGES